MITQAVSDSDEDVLFEKRREAALEEGVDLYDFEEWEPRTLFDRFCVYFDIGSEFLIKASFLTVSLGFVVLAALSMVLSPTLGFFLLASLVPAGFFVFYIWDTDPFDPVSLWMLTATFLLSAVFVTVPFAVSTLSFGSFSRVGGGMVLFFFFVVAPVEETTKWLAVRLYGYTQESFDSAANGAALGAVAGLGFAAMENAIYISGYGLMGFGGAEELTIARAGVAPFHVLWSAIAGYYLGLAKLNKRNAGPIMFKGLLIAGILHGVYNAGVYYLPGTSQTLAVGMDLESDPVETAMTGVFLLGYFGGVGYYVSRKLDSYRNRKISREKMLDVRSHMGMAKEEIDDLLTRKGTGTLAFADEDDAYSLPVSYGYDGEDRSIYLMFGYAPGSEKREWVRNTDTVSLTVYEMYKDYEARSVVVRGGLEEIDEPNYQDALSSMSDNAMFTVLHWSGAFLDDTDVEMYELQPESMNGRVFEHGLSEDS